MGKANSQKFIAKNRAPRVQIEYNVFKDGAEEKVELPFIVGIMADLSGKPREDLPSIADRKFEEIDSTNFDTVLKASKPRVNFQVPNTLTGEGNLSIDIDFESMDDFSPGKVAQKVDSLRKMLEARTELAALLTAMDGKPNAEKIIADMLGNDALLKSLAAASKSTEE